MKHTAPPAGSLLYGRMSIMANIGAVPIPSNELGQFRISVGDTSYVALVPPVSGQGDYTYFSDAELQAILDQSGSGNSGMAFAYRKLAAILALKAVNIATDDLRVATEQRAEIMRKLAKDFDDSAGNDASVTDIFQLAGGERGCRHAELAEFPWGCGCGVAVY